MKKYLDHNSDESISCAVMTIVKCEQDCEKQTIKDNHLENWRDGENWMDVT